MAVSLLSERAAPSEEVASFLGETPAGSQQSSFLLFTSDWLQVRGIPRDTWNMFLNFVNTVDSDLSLYDDTEAWPSLFDDFVEWENDQVNQNSSTQQDLNRESSASPSWSTLITPGQNWVASGKIMPKTKKAQ